MKDVFNLQKKTPKVYSLVRTSISSFFRMPISLFYIPDGSDLSQALQDMSTAYEEIGTMYEMQPKHDWDPLSNLLFEYRGLIYSFSGVTSLLKVCDWHSNGFIQHILLLTWSVTKLISYIK